MIVDDAEDTFQLGHLVGIKALEYLVLHKEQLGIRVVNDVVNGLRVELMQYGYCYCTVSGDGKECCTPTALVLTAQGHFVAGTNATVLEQNVQFFDNASHVLVLQGRDSIVRHRVLVPILLNGVEYKLVKASSGFHIIIIVYLFVSVNCVCYTGMG